MEKHFRRPLSLKICEIFHFLPTCISLLKVDWKNFTFTMPKETSTLCEFKFLKFAATLWKCIKEHRGKALLPLKNVEIVGCSGGTERHIIQFKSTESNRIMIELINYFDKWESELMVVCRWLEIALSANAAIFQVCKTSFTVSEVYLRIEYWV